MSAVIHLPASFSHDVLTLQDLDPVTAVIDYKVVKRDELSEQRLENQVSTILRDFNTRIVKLYFASIAGNISGAQVNMDTAVARQGSLVDKLTNSLYPDLDRTAKGYSSSVSLAGLLQSLNSGWISAQNSFTNSTTSTLTSVSEALDRQQPKLTDYFALQEQIAGTNVSNGNTAITDQGASDKSFYDQAFSSYIDGLGSGDGTWSGFDGFSSVDADGNATGVLATLENAVAGYDRLTTDFNARIDGVSDSLRGQQAALTDSLHSLQELETTLLAEYFSVTLPADNAAIGLAPGDIAIGDDNYDIDTSTLTDVMARRALAQKVADSFSTGGAAAATVGKYEKRIQDLLWNIPTDPAQYAGLFAALQGKSTFDPSSYVSALGLLKEYGDAHGIVSPPLNLVYPSTGTTTQSVTKTVPVTVPAGTSYTVSVASTGIPLTDITVGLGSPAPSCPALTPSCVHLDGTTRTATIDNQAGNGPMTVTLTYGIDLKNTTGPATVAYTAQDTTATPPAAVAESIGSDVYVLVPADATKEKIGGEDFTTITAHLGNIQIAANLLNFLFGAPDESLATFTSAVLATGDFAKHSTESVFNRYGTIDASQIATNLSQNDVGAYQKLGHDNIAAIVGQITGVKSQLQAIDGNLKTLSGAHLPEAYFSDSVSRLQAWYAAAIASVSASPAQWEAKSNTVTQLDTLPWNGQKEGKPELYLDKETGPALYRTMSELVAATSHDAQNVAASAQIIADNSAEFDALVVGVKQTQTDTQSVLDAMKGTIATGDADLAASSDYSKRFSTVLSNTRASGADPEKIYESFANPVTAKATTPAASATVAEAFDYRWVVIFLAGSLIGALLCSLIIRRKGRSRAAN